MVIVCASGEKIISFDYIRQVVGLIAVVGQRMLPEFFCLRWSAWSMVVVVPYCLSYIRAVHEYLPGESLW